MSAAFLFSQARTAWSTPCFSRRLAADGVGFWTRAVLLIRELFHHSGTALGMPFLLSCLDAGFPDAREAVRLELCFYATTNVSPSRGPRPPRHDTTAACERNRPPQARGSGRGCVCWRQRHESA